ncbi:MAG: 3-methyladenine DNA glycosylase [Melioribacteraceae bacterium]|nr:MAG: 3-methyladenine DNA glycosylase [Melioribacteraceae bacterium]
MQNNDLEAAIKHLSANDAIMATIIKKHKGINIKGTNEYFVSLTNNIIGQQLSVKAADSIIRRFHERFGTPVPEIILSAETEEIRSIGVSYSKIKYIKSLAENMLSGDLDFSDIDKLSDEKIIEMLTKVKGIGVWTSHMFLIFTLCRPDILAYGDLGVKKAIMLNYSMPNLPDENVVKEIALKYRWAPYQSIACRYLWKTLD